HGAVVQVGRAEPESVQGLIRVAVGFTEVAEALVGESGVEQVLVYRQGVRVGVEPVTVGADVGDRCDLADFRAREITAVRTVTGRAEAVVDRPAPRREVMVNWIRVDGWCEVEEPVLDALQRRAVERRRQRAGPEGRAAVALDRKSTRLNSSHVKISYAVFCLKK